MALDKPRLALTLKNALLAGNIANNNPDPNNPGETPPLTQICEAIAETVIDEILTNLDIEVPALTFFETPVFPVVGALGAPNLLPAACTVA